MVVLSVLLLVGAGVRLFVTGLLLVVTGILLVVTGFGLVVTGILLVISEFVWVATLGHGNNLSESRPRGLESRGQVGNRSRSHYV